MENKQKYIGIKEAAKRWGISDRRVRLLCQEGKIEGAIKLEWSWTIPADSPKPFDGRMMRRFKNHDLRLGSIDINTLNMLREKYPLDKSRFEEFYYSPLFEGCLETALSLAGLSFDKHSIESVLSGQIATNLTLSDHLLFVNFRSILSRSVLDNSEWDSKRIQDIHRFLSQGIDDFRGGIFRDGVASTALRGKESLQVNFQMETLVRQFEKDWKALYPVFRACIMYAEILRIRPFESLNEELALLLMLIILLQEGFRLPTLDSSMKDELNAATSLCFRRGNYQDLCRIVERSLIASYSENSYV